MRGLELSEKYWNDCGKAVIHNDFPEIEDYICVGLCGSGSECFGFDDELSRDHDFGLGFCLFIPDDIIESRTEFRLERAYSHLPKEFEGFTRPKISPVGGNRTGIIHYTDFFKEKTGSSDGLLSSYEWLNVPEKSLAEAVNGKIFVDNLGAVTQIRENLSFYPRDIFLKKLAGSVLTMAQAGQYNYNRCIKRGDTGGAQLSMIEFATAAIHTAYLLSSEYMPYYKWALRGMRELPLFSSYADTVEFLISSDNTPDISETKSDIIEAIAIMYISHFQQLGITEAICGDLEKHAYSINDNISDGDIRNLHIFSGA